MIKVDGNEVESTGNEKTLLVDYLTLIDYLYNVLSKDETLGKAGARRLLLRVVLHIFRKGGE